MKGLLILILFFAFSFGSEISLKEWTGEMEKHIKALYMWKGTVETILSQFALASFPKQFTPAHFRNMTSDKPVIEQQKIAMRSHLYYEAISTDKAEIRVYPAHKYITLHAIMEVVQEVKQLGFNVYWIEDGDGTGFIFLDKLSFEN